MKLYLAVRREHAPFAHRLLELFRKVVNGKGSLFMLINKDSVSWFTDCDSTGMPDDFLPVCLVLSEKIFRYVDFVCNHDVITLEVLDLQLPRALAEVCAEDHSLKLAKEAEFRFFKLTQEGATSTFNRRFEVKLADLATVYARFSCFMKGESTLAELALPGEQCQHIFEADPQNEIQCSLRIRNGQSSLTLSLNRPKLEIKLTKCQGRLRPAFKGEELEMTFGIHHNYWERLKELLAVESEVVLMVVESGQV
jgi:hypothetical protein